MSIGVALQIYYLGLDTLCPTDSIHFEELWISVITSSIVAEGNFFDEVCVGCKGRHLRSWCYIVLGMPQQQIFVCGLWIFQPWVTSSICSIQHEFPPVEQVLDSIRQLLIASKIKVPPFPCFGYRASPVVSVFHELRVGEDWQLLLSLGSSRILQCCDNQSALKEALQITFISITPLTLSKESSIFSNTILPVGFGGKLRRITIAYIILKDFGFSPIKNSWEASRIRDVGLY